MTADEAAEQTATLPDSAPATDPPPEPELPTRTELAARTFWARRREDIPSELEWDELSPLARDHMREWVVAVLNFWESSR